MEIILIILSILCLTISTVVVMIVAKKKTSPVDSALNDSAINILLNSIKQTESSMTAHLANMSMQQRNEADITQKKVDELTKRNEERIEKLTFDVNTNMRLIRQENEKQLDSMRETVDEKLNNSLTLRLNESFSKIRASLDTVGLGLGEMRALSTGVGDLKKMLSNVKARGVWGEVTLNSLLEQTLTLEQYSSNVQIKPNSLERVDFAVRLPGKDEQNILLPIDSKFPIEDYYRLVEATDIANIEEAEKAQKSLFKRIKDEAKKINEKYIYLPVTTDFAVMFLPLEGLYAEVVRNSELMDFIQNTHKVLVCGPTTIMAFLNSLQMGFKTMFIEKRSSEIWSMLGLFKQEFETFVNLLSKTQKKLDEATDTIELATKSSKKISKHLGSVSNMTSAETSPLPPNTDAE